MTFVDPSLDWETAIPWLREHTSLQIWLKGGECSQTPLNNDIRALTMVDSMFPRGRRTRNPVRHRRHRHLQPRRPTTGWHSLHPRHAESMRSCRTGSGTDHNRRWNPSGLRYLQGTGSRSQLLFPGKNPYLGSGCMSSSLYILENLTHHGSMMDKKAWNWQSRSCAKS